MNEPIQQVSATTRECVALLIYQRMNCRTAIRLIDKEHTAQRQLLRQARKLREAKNPLFDRRANTLEAEAKRHDEERELMRNVLMRMGAESMACATDFDAAIPQPLLLDLLNVNRADRHRVQPGDGFREIVFINGLEDSAMHRGSDFKEGPLAQAFLSFMCHELEHNEQLKQAADEHLFGKGGMFEFLPTYKRNERGEMVRQPPKLRLADKFDTKED